MSNNTNAHFSKFGTFCLILAILSLVAFIVGVGAYFIGFLEYVNWGVQLIIIVCVIIAAIAAGKAGTVLNNENLLNFRTKIIIAVILVMVGLILIGVGLSVILATAFGPDAGSPAAIRTYIAFGIMVLIGIAMVIVGAVLEIIAWSNLKKFFNYNLSMFPEGIGKSAKTGSFLCMLGAIFNITIILAPIGPILKVVGYFMLSKLKNME